MKRVTIAIAFVLISTICLVAQTRQPKIPETCKTDTPAKDERLRIIRLSHDQVLGMATKIVIPEYPSEPHVNVQGKVVIGVVIGGDGRTSCAWVISGHPMLLPAALKAAGQWEFESRLASSELAGTIVFQVRNKHYTISRPQISETCSERDLLRDDGGVVWFTHEQMKARTTKMVNVEIPKLPMQARVTGTVVLGVVVSKSGSPECVWVVSGHPMLAPRVMEAAKKWRFRSEVVSGRPLAFAGILRFQVTNSEWSY